MTTERDEIERLLDDYVEAIRNDSPYEEDDETALMSAIDRSWQERDERIAVLEKALRSANDYINKTNILVRTAQYEADELGQGPARLCLALQQLDTMGYDGTLASIRDEIDAALATKESVTAQQGERSEA